MNTRPDTGNTWLIVGAGLSFLAAALHIAIIFGGGDWYRFFGAGEGMARLAESGSREPAKMTLGIATVLTGWGLYALSGAGLIFRLPWRRLVLFAITAIYTVRGLAGLIAPWWIDHPAIAQNSMAFWLWSSVICLVFGACHAVGLWQRWSHLSVNPG